MKKENKATNAKQRAQRTRDTKKAFLKALENTLGVKTPAARKIGINPSTVYMWINDDPEFAKAVKEIEEQVLDFSESHLYQQIAENNTTATIFHLKTKGKHRGWIERVEFQDKSKLDDHLESMTDDEIVGLIKNLTSKLNG